MIGAAIFTAIVHVSFYALIGFSCYTLESAWPLLALLIAPLIEIQNKKPIKQYGTNEVLYELHKLFKRTNQGR